MIQDFIHSKICKNIKTVDSWFAANSKDLSLPIYSSFDIRDSGFKVAPVDANVFPAGFNNICDVDKESSVEHLKSYLVQKYDLSLGHIALIAEEHTANAFYWENVNTIYNLAISAGYKVSIIWPNIELLKGKSQIEVEAINGAQLAVHDYKVKDGQLFVNGTAVDLAISNNDFSSGAHKFFEGMKTPMNPPLELGWYRRRKENFFELYNELVDSFCEVIDVESGLLRIKTQTFSNFDIGSIESRDLLAKEVDRFIEDLEQKYKKWGVDQKPFVFIKNSAGTYGLGVVKANSGEEITHWNNKLRTKMKAAKGGGGFTEVIIQEGISTRFVENGVSAEPTIYLLGGRLAGGFLRSHSKKGPDDNLNSPGAIYKRLCVSDLKVDVSDCPMENVYGWIAKMGVIAIAKEAQKENVTF